MNNVTISTEKSRHVKHRLLEQTYSKKYHSKFLKRSLENVSTHPHGEFETDQSTLQRSRSLAISREAGVLNDINLSTGNRQRRQQLIPRAKLIDKHGVKERCGSKDRIHEIYQSKDTLRKCSSISSDYELPHSRTIDSDFGLSLPNYYPDSDISLTDLSSDKFSFKEEKRSQSTNNLYRQDSAEIVYHDNISFGKSYDDKYFKPRTIRHYTPFDHDLNHFYEGKPRSLPNCSIAFGEESHLYDSADLKIYEELDEVFKEEISDFSQSDLNFDEINLNNDNITKTISVDSCFETNPIYDEIPAVEVHQDNVILKTCVQVKGEEEDYKTIINVDDEVTESPRHSHRYLKDFIESQKGSKKPLQTFLSRKISRAFEGIKKEESNQYYSLPDLSIGKNLRYCEKIDKKLRKCENSNRFIVNIGRHFDVTAESNIPVDFEVKISKIPKLKRAKSIKREDKEEEFIDAVKNLNNTLNGIQQSTPEVVEVNKQQSGKRLGRAKYKKHKENVADVKSEKTKLPRITEVAEMDVESNKEYQKKLGTMRNYWGKINEKDKSKVESPKCKIVDVQTKVEDVIKKFENKEEKDAEKEESIVRVAKQIFENSGKGSPIKEKVHIFENRSQYESLNPNIVEIIEKNEEKQHQTVKALSDAFETEFDHVRYRVMKSDLFQKNIFANCQKESQFDGLMQYLQHYSFQELLIDNNIVIIEPIRTKIEHEATPSTKSPKILTKMLHKSQNTETKDASLRRRFFYHPIRVNKEMNEDELPNPDTVKLVRQLFENGLKKSQSSQALDEIKPTKKTVQYQTIDPDKDNCSITDSSNTTNPSSEAGSNDNEELCCELQYVSEDVMQKIRECGTSVTYYGGKVLEKNHDHDPNIMTETIMEEIKRDCKCANPDNKDAYNGVKFKLLKSNSCSSRIELVGTENLEKSKQKYFDKQKYLIDQKNRENQRKNSCIKEQDESEEKEVGDEKQLTQWSNLSEQKTYNNIMFSKTNKKSNYDYHNYEQIRRNSNKMDEIEFENYEIAGT